MQYACARVFIASLYLRYTCLCIDYIIVFEKCMSTLWLYLMFLGELKLAVSYMSCSVANSLNNIAVISGNDISKVKASGPGC